MKKQTAVIIGATGLIGSLLVETLLNDDYFDKVRILVRRPYEKQHPKLEVFVLDFGNLDDYANKLGNGESIFCCIGTTQKKVNGDKAAYRKIDYDIAVNAAILGKKAGFTKYLLVSSLGADSNASGFYLKLKGEIETEIASIGFASFHILRPSFLLGVRNETRIGEGIMKVVFKGLSSLFFGGWTKYKAVEAQTVANAMAAAAKEDLVGQKIYYYDEMNALL
jgi:uncharacterized protein YbjT (DUF2867 family)